MRLKAGMVAIHAIHNRPLIHSQTTDVDRDMAQKRTRPSANQAAMRRLVVSRRSTINTCNSMLIKFRVTYFWVNQKFDRCSICHHAHQILSRISIVEDHIARATTWRDDLIFSTLMREERSFEVCFLLFMRPAIGLGLKEQAVRCRHIPLPGDFNLSNALVNVWR